MLTQEAGQDAPVVDNEATIPATATAPAETTATDTQTVDAEKEPAVERTYSQKEFQESIEKATAKAAAKAERRAYREALQTLAPQQQQATQQADDKPVRGNYANDEQYIDDLTDWKLNQRESVGRQAQAQQQQQQQLTKAEAIYADAMKAGLDRDDLNEVAEAMTPLMRSAVVESDAAGKLMAYMAGNPDEVARISALSPYRQAVEIGKLETKVTSGPKVSAAPPPIKTIGGSASSTKTIETATGDEYVALRRSQGARWAR